MVILQPTNTIPIPSQTKEAAMATQINSTEVLGARLLREVAAEEGSLEEVRFVSQNLIDKAT